MTITFYDIPSSLPQKAFSMNTWQVRFCLNYKSIQYKTIWLDYPDIEPTLKNIGIAPTSTKVDGSPCYTLPAIHDASTGVSLAGSFAIAEYFEKTYLTPSVFPHGTLALQMQFEGSLRSAALKPLLRVVLNDAASIVHSVNAQYLQNTREAVFGMDQEIFPAKGDKDEAHWSALEAALGTVDAWYKKTEGPFVMGTAVSWADFVVASWLICLRTINDQRWKEIGTWHGGRWLSILSHMQEYEQIL